jgi:hypothetical protein
MWKWVGRCGQHQRRHLNGLFGEFLLQNPFLSSSFFAVSVDFLVVVQRALNPGHAPAPPHPPGLMRDNHFQSAARYENDDTGAYANPKVFIEAFLHGYESIAQNDFY